MEKSIWALGHDLESDARLKRRFHRLREYFMRRQPSASRPEIIRAIFDQLMAEAPNEARQALAWQPVERDAARRLGQLEQAKARTHGLEWRGEITGGNFGAHF